MTDNNFYGFTGVITHAGCLENTRKTSGKKLLKSRVHLAWLSSSFQNFGNCWPIWYWKLKFKQEILVEWNLLGGVRVEEWQGFFQVLKYVTPLTTLLIFSEIWHPMVCNLHFASRVGDNCRTFLRQLGFLHLSYLFAVLFQRSSQLFNFSGEKDALL